MSLDQRRQILNQSARQLRPPVPGAYDPAQPQPRSTDVQIPINLNIAVNIRLALYNAPPDILFKVRDQVNELINMRHLNNGGK